MPATLPRSLPSVLQPDGRLVVAGETYRAEANTRGIELPRFGADGSLDNSFGQDGYVLRNGNSREFMGRLILQPDGKLLVFADVESAAPRNWYDWSPAITRLNGDGSLDAAFGNNGRAIVSSDAAFASVAFQSDGKILVAVANDPYPWDFLYCGAVLARLHPDGRLDDSFGIDGLKRVRLGGCETFGTAMLIEPAGNIVLTGIKETNDIADQVIDSLDHVVTRLTSSGELDGSSTQNGQSIVDVGDGRYLPYARTSGDLLRQDDIWQPGDCHIRHTRAESRGDNNRIVIARLLASGGSPGLIGIKAVGRRAEESDGRIPVLIRRSGGSQGIVSVDYSTTSGSASSSDFIPMTGTLTWADGDRADKTIVIEIVADSQIEGDERFTLSLANSAGGASLATSEIEVTINDVSSPAVTTPQPGLPATNSNASGGGGGGGGAMSWEVLMLMALLILRLIWPSQPAGKNV